MKRPDFFLVGAPKCGTTALQQYLAGHPAIFMCEPKEPNYFTDFEHPRFRATATLPQYLELFEEANDAHLAVGEASASYLFLKEAIARLREFEPAARIVVLLRDPVAMVQAWHAQLLYSHEETEKNLRAAWQLQDERRQGQQLPPHHRDVRALLYREVATFTPQLEHLFTHFPRKQVLVLLQEDLARDTLGVYRQTLDFLGVPDDERTEFPRVNVAKTAADGPLLRWAVQPPSPVLRVVRALKRSLGLPRTSLLAGLRLRRAVKGTRPPLDEQFRVELEQAFRPDVLRLARLLNRNLNSWPTAQTPSS